MSKENKTLYVILGLLNHEPMTGYDIKKKIDLQISYFWDAGYGQIYPTLQKLADDGLVSMRVESGDTGMERKIYSITARGRETLVHWLQLPGALENVKYEILLKLFFGSEIPVDESIRLINEFKNKHMQNLEIFNQYSENLKQVMDQNPDHVFYLLTVLFGQYIQKAYLEWADEAVKILDEQVKSKN